MNVFLVAFEFPPLATGGVQRPLRFAKYLPEFGISPIVITTDEESFRRVMDAPQDPTLLESLPPAVPVERIPCVSDVKPRGRIKEWARIYFSLVESQAKAWRPALEKRLPELIQKYQPQAILVTVPPFCMAPLWLDIGRRFGIPVVLDLRDAWSQWRVSPYGTWLHYRLTLELERSALSKARTVICTSEQNRSDLLRLHPVDPAKLITITNGYDEDRTDWQSGAGAGAHGTPFVIGYVGSFYYTPEARAQMMNPWWTKRGHRKLQFSPRKEDWLYRSPYFFFAAIERLIAARPELRGSLKIRFVGREQGWLREQVESFHLDDVVECLGFMDHESALQFQKQCDALLVTSSKVIGGFDYSIAGKTFEYIGLNKPIIGMVAPGAQKALLEQTGLAQVCDPDNPADAAQKIADLIDGRASLRPNVPFLRTLHRRELTGRLASVLRSASRSDPAPVWWTG